MGEIEYVLCHSGNRNEKKVKGNPREIKIYETTFTIMGKTETTYEYQYSSELFVRPVRKAYRITVHESRRVDGKVTKKQIYICTIGYYDIVDWGGYIMDYITQDRKEKILESLGLDENTLCAVVYAKLQPVIDRVKEEYAQTKEYKVTKEHRRIVGEYQEAARQFAEKYQVDRDEYKRCYDIFGVLRNKEYLEKIKREYKARKKYERQSRSYYEKYYSKADSADLFKDDKQKVDQSEILSEKGKRKEIAENRRLFAEAMEGYRERMLAIVDRREEDYTAFNVGIVQTRLGTSSYQSALTANLAMLRQGFCGKIEVMAMLRLYKEDDLAYSQVEDIMRQNNNPYCNLLEDHITVKKQLNAFESIRRIIRSKVNTYLAEHPVYRPSVASRSGLKENRFSREASYFGSGYVAIVEELEEDLTINSPVATLALKYNSDPKSVYYAGNNIDVMKAEHSVKKQQEKQETKPT